LKILVTIKRVEDYESKIKVKPDNTWIVTEGVNYRANPFDEIAVEEALRLRDTSPSASASGSGGPSEVVAVSIGSAAATAEIRSALAMGADRGILVKHDGFVDSDAVARLLVKVVEKEKPDLILMGKQAVDVDDNVTGQLLAEYLGYGQVTFASKKESLESPEEKAKKPGIRLQDGGAGSAGDGRSPKGGAPMTAQVVREVDGGVETLEVQLPAVVTVDLRLNIPRYASLPNIMKAKKKPIEELAPAALGVDVAPKVKVVRVEPPPARAAGVKVPDVATLIKKLHEEAKVV
jgi:electron transfer flavoprotein beta subunit